MRPLLGSHFVRPVGIGRLSDEDFERVKLEAQPFRPKNRCKKDINSKKVIVSQDCVFLTPEYDLDTIGDTFSVEIKPKQGWHSLKASCSVDLCHRCLKQYAKLYRGEISSISEYCPLDLFSGDKVRMKRAIFDLCDNPCNRFKLFRNGNLVYTDNIGSISDMEKELSKLFGNPKSNSLDLLSALLCTALLSPMEDPKPISVREDFVPIRPESIGRNNGCCDTRNDPLPNNCILQRLLTLQKHTQISDHDAKVICDRLLSNVDDLDGLHQLVLWGPNDKLEYQLTSDEIDAVLQLQRFLLSVTAKDVSILITFREIRGDVADPSVHVPYFDFPMLNKRFRLMISVIDLDPKSVHRISSWVQRKEEWLRIYFNSICENKI